MSGLSPQTARPRRVAGPAGTITERFFQGSLYILLVMGFCALASTGKLDSLSLGLVACALLLRGSHLFKGKNVAIPERLTSILTLLYFLFYAVDYFLLSQGFVSATVHMVLFIMVIKIFSVRRDRDLVYLAVLSFLMVLAAAVLTVDTVFLITFCLFMLTAITTFVSMEMRRSEREPRVIAISPANENRFNRSLYSAAGLLAIFTLIGATMIFFVLPRMNAGGYLQSLGTQGDFVTGFSESVRLGGIGKLQQSNAAVMHVQVLRGILPADVKWRGVALANFDGRRWSNPAHDIAQVQQLRSIPLDLRSVRIARDVPLYSWKANRSTLAYRVVMEPVGSYIFFLASSPVKLSGSYSGIAISIGGSVIKWGDARTVDAYEGEADTTPPAPQVLDSASDDYPPGIAMTYLGVPSRLDARIPVLAQQITANAESNYARAKAIESYLRTKLGYTLELPGEEADPLANFLFQRKKGHCEYFASAMAIMLRTLGIPTRVVNGFRGGEYNDLNRTYIIRGRDAHSWVEVYFPEYGWATFDPTPAVPAVSGNDAWSRLGLYMDALHQMWREWVINYDFSHQMRLSAEITSGAGSMQGGIRRWYWRKYRQILMRVKGMRGGISAGGMTLICLLGALIIALPFAPRAWRAIRRNRLLKNPQQAPSMAASLWYARMLKLLARKGIRKTPPQTPAEFASTIPDPAVREDVVVFTECYERARFAESAEDAGKLPELYGEIAANKTPHHR
jgi:transglutaminase-like putative cysteine protease